MSKFKRGDVLITPNVDTGDIKTDMILLVLKYKTKSTYNVLNMGDCMLSYKHKEEVIELHVGKTEEVSIRNLKGWEAFPMELYPLSLKLQVLKHLSNNQ